MPISPEGSSSVALQQMRESATQLLRTETVHDDKWLLEVINLCKDVFDARWFTGRPQEQEVARFISEYATRDFNTALITTDDVTKANYILTRIVHPMPEIPTQ